MASREQDVSRLTPRQGEVYALIEAGLTNAEIAVRLGFEKRTAEQHRRNIHRALGLHRTSPLAMLRRLPRGTAVTALDLSALSPKQRDIFHWVVVEGLSTRATAQRLGMNPRTVEAHRGKIAARLGVAPREVPAHLPELRSAPAR